MSVFVEETDIVEELCESLLPNMKELAVLREPSWYDAFRKENNYSVCNGSSKEQTHLVMQSPPEFRSIL